MNNPNFTPVFTIFKEGRTIDGAVAILRENGKPYDIEAKVKFYESLGYTVTILPTN